ncbi:hypothetical protein ACP6L2_06470 [Sphingobacterium lactis]|uniref:RipA family octameric membrane protein n=1 Tax=Sphingobacterium lactis TaxID=797291 RepID=UPI003F7DE18B
MINFNFKKQPVVSDSKSTKEDLQRVLDKLYRCRDLEIANLWQRSVFLSVFLILCFTGHGYLILETYTKEKDPAVNSLIMGQVISVIGIIMSIIWICMAKGSKAWYEVYEEGIVNFEHKHYEKLGIPFENVMGNMNIERNSLDSNVFSTHGGKFSPSKINIVIGQVCLIWWCLSYFLYVVQIIFRSLNDGKIILKIESISILLITIVFLLFFIFRFHFIMKSGFLTKVK